MLTIFSKPKGMNIIGQGVKIFLFTLPFILIALYLQFKQPGIAALPKGLDWLKPIGWIWLIPGVVLWGTAVWQLLTAFSQGKLVTTGAYSIVRNPIYSCLIWFVLPAVCLLTQTWVYLLPAIFLYLGINLFIGKEEVQLHQAFGKDYEDYCKRVSRLIPFARPWL